MGPRATGPVLGDHGACMKCLVRADVMVGAFAVIRVPIGVSELIDDLIDELLWQGSVPGHGMGCDKPELPLGEFDDQGDGEREGMGG